MTQIKTILVTNGGPHPADKWAEVTSDAIVNSILIDANEDDASDAAISARKAKRALRSALFEVFCTHHGYVQDVERRINDTVKKPADAGLRVLAPLDPTEHMTIMNAVNDEFDKTPWKNHFTKPETQRLVFQIIAQHTIDVMHIERRWHHDRLTKKA